MLDCEWLARFAAAVGVLGVFIASALAVNAQSPIEIEEIKFEPVGPGKNVVHVVAKNASSIDRMLMVVVAARSPGTREVKKGEMGVGYPQFRDGAYIDHGANLKAGQSNDIRYPFEIPEPIAPRSLIAIQLFDSKAANPMNA